MTSCPRDTDLMLMTVTSSMLDTIVEMNQLKIARVKVNMKGAFSEENRFVSIASPIREERNLAFTQPRENRL